MIDFAEGVVDDGGSCQNCGTEYRPHHFQTNGFGRVALVHRCHPADVARWRLRAVERAQVREIAARCNADCPDCGNPYHKRKNFQRCDDCREKRRLGNLERNRDRRRVQRPPKKCADCPTWIPQHMKRCQKCAHQQRLRNSYASRNRRHDQLSLTIA
jgi:hypothetical protein